MIPKPLPQKAPANRRGLSAWLRLSVSMILLYLLMTVVGPIGLQLPGYRQMERFIARNNLKATAIYYTDLEEFARSERIIRDGFSFAPSGRFDGVRTDRP